MMTTSRSNVPSEYDEQRVVCRYLDFLGLKYVHIVNEGLRSVQTGARLKKIGMQRGFPDLQILKPSGKYHGLFIEMKSLKGRPTSEQKQWIVELNSLGYYATVCRGFDEAKQVINDYLKGKL